MDQSTNSKAIIPSWHFAMVSILILTTLVACDREQVLPAPATTVPEAYQFERDGVSTVAFDGQTTRIKMATELVHAMKDFNSDASKLVEMYSNQTLSGEGADPFRSDDLNASVKSLKSKVAASVDLFGSNSVESAKIKQDIQNWLEAQVAEVFPQQYQLASPGQAGQIADGTAVRYVSAKGLEYDQAVNKSLIGALMVDQLINHYLSVSVLDAGTNRTENSADITINGEIYTVMEHMWDEAYGYLFGSSASPADPLVDLGTDAFLNKYLARVEADEDFEGIATEIYDAFKLGRAAIVAGDYNLRDQQAEIIRNLVSEIIGIRAVHYLQKAKRSVAARDFGAAFHDLSEGFGFIYSLRFVRMPHEQRAMFSREDIDGYLNVLLAGNGFWQITPEDLDSLSEVIAERFDFSVSEAGR